MPPPPAREGALCRQEEGMTHSADQLGRFALLPFAALFAASCAAPPGTPSSAAPSSGASGSTTTSSGPKTIRLAVDVSSEPAGGMMLIGRGGAVGLENYLLFHAGLTIYDQDSNLTPSLAERLPTLEDGDWRLSP